MYEPTLANSYVSCEGSGEPAQMHSLAKAFVACIPNEDLNQTLTSRRNR